MPRKDDRLFQDFSGNPPGEISDYVQRIGRCVKEAIKIHPFAASPTIGSSREGVRTGNSYPRPQNSNGFAIRSAGVRHLAK